LIHWNFSFT